MKSTLEKEVIEAIQKGLKGKYFEDYGQIYEVTSVGFSGGGGSGGFESSSKELYFGITYRYPLKDKGKKEWKSESSWQNFMEVSIVSPEKLEEMILDEEKNRGRGRK